MKLTVAAAALAMALAFVLALSPASSTRAADGQPSPATTTATAPAPVIAAQPAKAFFALPAGAKASLGSLRISPKLGKAVYRIERSNTQTQPPTIEVQLLLVDLATGKARLLESLLPRVPDSDLFPGPISPDGAKLIVAQMRRNPQGEGGITTVYVLDLLEEKPVKLIEAPFATAVWAGKEVAVATTDADGNVAPLKLFDVTGKSRELPARVVVVASADAADVLFAVGNGRDLTAKLSLKQDPPALMAMDSSGKVLAELIAGGAVASPPVASPNGRFLALQTKPPGAPEGPDTEYALTVVDVSSKKPVSFKLAAAPLAVMDDGRAFVLNMPLADAGSTLGVLALDGRVTKLADGVRDAQLVGGELIFATGGEKPLLKSLAVK